MKSVVTQPHSPTLTLFSNPQLYTGWHEITWFISEVLMIVFPKSQNMHLWNELVNEKTEMQVCLRIFTRRSVCQIESNKLKWGSPFIFSLHQTNYQLSIIDVNDAALVNSLSVRLPWNSWFHISKRIDYHYLFYYEYQMPVSIIKHEIHSWVSKYTEGRELLNDFEKNGESELASMKIEETIWNIIHW